MSENINNVNYDTECSEDYRVSNMKKDNYCSEIEGPWLQKFTNAKEHKLLFG